MELTDYETFALSSSTFHGGAWVWYLVLLEVDFYFFLIFCYQWDTTTRGGVLCKLSRWSFQLLLTTASSCGGCFSWYVVEVYFHMYSIYEGGFYGDYYSEAVMCGTMSDMKRGTCKYVLKYVHTWYIVRSWNYIYVVMLWSRLSQMRHSCLRFGRIVNHILL